MIGSILGFKFRHVLENLLPQYYKIKQFQPDVSHIPDNEASIIQSIKSLYDLNPRTMLYRVIIKIIKTIAYIFVVEY